MAIRTINGDLLSTQTASASASLDFDAVFSSAYPKYLIEFFNLIPSSDGDELFGRFGTSGTPDTATDYQWSSTRLGTNSFGTANTVFQLADDTTIGVGSDAGYGLSGHIIVINPFDSSLVTAYTGSLVAPSTAAFLGDYHVAGGQESTGSHTDIQIYYDTGNIASGTITVKGIR